MVVLLRHGIHQGDVRSRRGDPGALERPGFAGAAIGDHVAGTLRFVLDAVGSELVVLGSDGPAPLSLEDPVHWLRDLTGLSDAEKRAILEENPARLLGR